MFARSLPAEVVGELADRRQVVDRDAEEAVHLRGVQRHRDHAAGAGGDQQVGDEPAADRDARGVLLVGAGVGVVRDDGGDLRRRRAAGRVEHQQQLHEVLLRRRHERLHDVHVALAAVRLELHLQAVVAEAVDGDRRQRHAQSLADAAGELLVGATAEHDDLPHVRRPYETAAPFAVDAACAVYDRRSAGGGPETGEITLHTITRRVASARRRARRAYAGGMLAMPLLMAQCQPACEPLTSPPAPRVIEQRDLGTTWQGRTITAYRVGTPGRQGRPRHRVDPRRRAGGHRDRRARARRRRDPRRARRLDHPDDQPRRQRDERRGQRRRRRPEPQLAARLGADRLRRRPPELLRPRRRSASPSRRRWPTSSRRSSPVSPSGTTPSVRWSTAPASTASPTPPCSTCTPQAVGYPVYEVSCGTGGCTGNATQFGNATIPGSSAFVVELGTKTAGGMGAAGRPQPRRRHLGGGRRGLTRPSFRRPIGHVRKDSRATPARGGGGVAGGSSG